MQEISTELNQILEIGNLEIKNNKIQIICNKLLNVNIDNNTINTFAIKLKEYHIDL